MLVWPKCVPVMQIDTVAGALWTLHFMFRLSEFQSVVDLVTNQSISQMCLQIEIVISTGRDTFLK